MLSLAPDDASRRAGSKLGTAGPWSEAGSSGAGAVWGLCKGSGSKPYRTVVDTAEVAYKCSCPSRKFPCKHALGLLLLWVSDDHTVPDTEEEPGWAGEWLEGRRKHAEKKQETGAAVAKAADPEAARRRAERRAERITSGATELEQRLSDLLRGGLAAAERPGYGLWEETAARMVDAQAPGLAGRVRELGAIPSSGQGWPVRLLEECALLHMLDRAWLGLDRLPEALAATVRSRVGLPAVADGRAVRDHWLVLAQYDTADGRLTTRRIWLRGRASGRTALVLDFGPPGRPPQLSLSVGLVLDAALTPFAGSGQLRAELGKRFAAPAPLADRPPGVDTRTAVGLYGQALLDDPWLDSWPVTLHRVIPVPADGGWQLADAEGDSALPVSHAFHSLPGLWQLAALSGGAPVTVFGECGHRGFNPLTAWPEGPGEAVALA